MGRAPISKDGWAGLATVAHYDSKSLAKLCGLSPRQLQRRFSRFFGRSPRDWLNEQRILAAQQLLLSGEPIKEVAFDLGFKRISHFYRQFKSTTHLTPLQFVSVNLARAQMSFRDNECRSQRTNVVLGESFGLVP